MTGRYKAYSEYKDSGVDWLHDIPSHWKTIPVGRCYHRVKRTGYESEELLSVYRDYGVIPKSSRDDNNNKASDDLSPYQLVCENNLVMNKMKAWQGSIAISEHRGIVSPAYFVYEPFKNTESIVYPKYVHYLLRHPIYITQYMSRSKGIRVNQWDLDPESFQSIELLLPRKEEQQKIIRFLDHETAKIDTLITKQEKLIELLKEKRQAVISHAVTKGLNPDAPMKDSGVEWLGEVPEHWEVTRAKFVSNVFVPQRNKPELNSNSIGISWATMDDMKSDFISSTQHSVSEEAFKSAGSKALPKDSVIASCVGNFGVASINKIDVVINQQLQAYIPTIISPLYLRELVSISKSYFELVGTAATLVYVNQQGFENLPITLPSIQEQQGITDYLTAQKGKFDKLIDKCFSQVELFRERKTALISAAVTGKIDVRDWKPVDSNLVEVA